MIRALNAKMNEYCAAVGLAMLDEWTSRRRAWADLTGRFRVAAMKVPGLGLPPGFGDGWISSVGVVDFPDAASAELAESFLTRGGIETRRWWARGCHRQTAYADCPRDPLPVTDALADRTLGLPFWPGLDQADLMRVFSALPPLPADFQAASA